MSEHKNYNNYKGGQHGKPREGNPNRQNHTPQPQEIPYSEVGNLGLLFTRRYFEKIKVEMVDDPKGKVAEKYYREHNDNIIAQSKASIGRNGVPSLPNNVANSQFELTTCYPGLITGIGISHSSGQKNEAKLGLSFDHTTGLPFIPGSSVKGLLRSTFPAPRKDNERERCDFIREKIEKELSDDEIKRLCIEIFGSDNKDKDNHIQGSDFFFDAFPVSAKNGLLDLDYITPHTGGEFSEPTPIQFMRIKPEVKFRFSFKLTSTKLSETVTVEPKDKEKLFKAILTTVGIGAKTNVGYGQLKEDVKTKQ